MMLGDHFNLYYYYQHFHKKTVIAGYITKIKSPQDGLQYFVHADMYVGQVLSRVPDKSKLKFENLIDVENIDKLRQSRAKYIILHKNLSAEWSAPLQHRRPDICPAVTYLNRIYRETFGLPVYEDENLIVFRISSGSKQI